MNKLNDVLYCIPRFYPSISGAEFYILNLANQLQLASKKAVIYCSTAIDFKGIRNPDGLHINPSHPQFSSFKNIIVNRFVPEFSYNLQDYFQLLRSVDLPNDSGFISLLENGPYQVSYFIKLFESNTIPIPPSKILHSSYLPYATIVFTLILSRKMGVPSICTPFIHMNNPRYHKIDYSSVLKFYDKIICCTEVEKTHLIKKGISQEKICVIPMGVDLSLYETPKKTRSGKIKSFKKVFGISKPFVLYCGYKNYEKGAISLLQAALKTHIHNPNLMYVFIGPSTPTFDSEIKKIRHQGVSVLNLTPDNLKGYFDWRKISAFQECEMYVMPSRSDAYGISYLEAWASKKPVIGANTPVMREVIHHKKDGLLVEFDDISQISESILLLNDNPQKEKEMGQRGYEKIKKHNSWKNVFNKTLSVYSQLVDW